MLGLGLLPVYDINKRNKFSLCWASPRPKPNINQIPSDVEKTKTYEIYFGVFFLRLRIL